MLKRGVLFGVLLFLGSARAAGKSDFLSLCTQTMEERGESAGFCKQFAQKFFGGAKAKNAVTIISPVDVGAPKMSVDPKVQYVIFNDPNYLVGVAYCYFVFRGWVDTTKVTPDSIALSSSGFSILNEDITAYQKWITSDNAGQSCRALVEKESGVPTTNLAQVLGGHAAFIGLNPLASVKNGHIGFDEIHDDLRLTMNHERIHAFQVLCPTLEAWGQQMWKELAPEEQAKFPVVYPSYNWKDLKVAGREYVAFSFETKPLKISEHVGKCKLR
ncbi:MAG: hypothetical protein ABIR96_02955 [Bdellovibrionota bacterium]